jgi:uncharacterized protein involved in exopolysaccharide biosynthesis
VAARIPDRGGRPQWEQKYRRLQQDLAAARDRVAALERRREEGEPAGGGDTAAAAARSEAELKRLTTSATMTSVMTTSVMTGAGSRSGSRPAVCDVLVARH